ncbi:hypothetical protein ACFL1X_06010 [Candidatus Hydrogenedentota bacterium]
MSETNCAEKMSWLDRQFKESSIALFLLLPLCCFLPTFLFAIIGLIACKDKSARKRASVLLYTTVGWFFMFVFLVLFLPELLRPRKDHNEISAIGSLNAIKSGQAGFSKSKFLDADSDGVGDYASLAQLAGQDDAFVLDWPFIDSELGSGTKNGYRFTVTTDTVDEGEEAYTVSAEPINPGKTGNEYYFMDESGVVRSSDGGPASVNSEPIS